MTIKVGNAANGLEIAATDTTLLSSDALERKVISSATLHEQTGAAETVELFLSADATSAAGERIDILKFSPDETKNPVSLFNRAIPASTFLVAKATTGVRVECNITFTLYNGDDL